MKLKFNNFQCHKFCDFRLNLLILGVSFSLLLIDQIHCLQKPLSSSPTDPYNILGLGSGATAPEIRKAYKELAKEWHPDKNKAQGAQDKFVQITKAYELLSDPERRKLYDDHGITESDSSGNPQNHQNHGHTYQFYHPYEDILTFSTGGSFHFPFADGIAYLNKKSVSSKTFDQTVLPKSSTIPQLILFYGDYCMGCAKAAPAWRTITDDLESIGMDVLCIHGERERTVSRRMGISAVPAIVLLIEGQPYHYRDNFISASKVIAFVRSKIPPEVIAPIDSTNVEEFLNSWGDNRIRVLIFGSSGPGGPIKLRYLMVSFQYRERVAFGYVQPTDLLLRSHFNVQKTIDTILVFKELAKPVASLSMGTIPYNLLKDLLENNKFLILPRLSSQPIMDSICPTESSLYRRHLCVILLTEDHTKEQDLQNSLRNFAKNSELLTTNRVKFAYILPEKQKDFFHALVNGGLKTPSQNLVILWRQDRLRASYEWTDWDGTNGSSQKLEGTLHKLLFESSALSYQTEIKELIDEHAKSFLSKIFKKMSSILEFVRANLTREVVIQAASLIATILFVVAGGFIMAYLVRLEEEAIAAKAANSNSNGSQSNQGARTPGNRARASSTNPTASSGSGPSGTSASGAPRPSQCSNGLISTSPDLKIHEMRSETYNGLVKLIKPGCRTLILLTDAETKPLLLPKFQKCIWPYRKNKSLQFGYMHVDKGGGLTWYKELLLLSLAEPRNLNINPRNCVGTVLSLNGYRRYFCVFHATLPGVGGGNGKHRQRTASGGYRNGGFLGFDSSDRSSSDDEDNSDVESNRRAEAPQESTSPHPNILYTSHLLDNLSNWLDRLFEGTTHRYHINYWPDFLVK